MEYSIELKIIATDPQGSDETIYSGGFGSLELMEERLRSLEQIIDDHRLAWFNEQHDVDDDLGDNQYKSIRENEDIGKF